MAATDWFRNMSPNLIKVIGTVVVGAVGALVHTGILPVPAAVVDPIIGFIVGWLHLPQPGTVKAD